MGLVGLFSFHIGNIMRTETKERLLAFGIAFLLTTIVSLASFLIVSAYFHVVKSKQQTSEIKQQESDWPKTVTSAGRMITVEHDGHQYVITTHGQNGVHVINSPNCPCLLKAER